MRTLILGLVVLLFPLGVVFAEDVADGSIPSTEPPVLSKDPPAEPVSDPVSTEPGSGTATTTSRPDDPVSSPAGGGVAPLPGSTPAPTGGVEPAVSGTDESSVVPSSAEQTPEENNFQNILVALVVAFAAVVPLGLFVAQFFKKKEPEEEKEKKCFDIKSALDKKMEELADIRGALQGKAEGAAREQVKRTVLKSSIKNVYQSAEALEKEIARLKKLHEECILGLNKKSMQKITPFLWFNNQCDEAMQFYTSLFPHSSIKSVKRYPTDMQVGPVPNMGGKVLTGVFELAGYQFMALDGGPHFTFTPAVSISVQCESEAEIDALYAKLSKGGKILMPLQDYGFSKKYVWLNDRFGLSWQLNVPHDFSVVKHKIAPFFMFYGEHNGKAEEAVKFYTSHFKQAHLGDLHRYGAGDQGGKEGDIQHGVFYLEGQEFMAIDGGMAHEFPITGAVSMHVSCETQEEIDHLWGALSAYPEAEQCGWLKDKYGFAWQIDARVLGEMMSDQNQKKANAALSAMLEMKKIDIATIKKAFDEA